MLTQHNPLASMLHDSVCIPANFLSVFLLSVQIDSGIGTHQNTIMHTDNMYRVMYQKSDTYHMYQGHEVLPMDHQGLL